MAIFNLLSSFDNTA